MISSEISDNRILKLKGTFKLRGTIYSLLSIPLLRKLTNLAQDVLESKIATSPDFLREDPKLTIASKGGRELFNDSYKCLPLAVNSCKIVLFDFISFHVPWLSGASKKYLLNVTGEYI